MDNIIYYIIKYTAKKKYKLFCYKRPGISTTSYKLNNSIWKSTKNFKF